MSDVLQRDVVKRIGSADSGAWTAALGRLLELATLADKPEETPASTLRVLWLTAAGEPASVQLARERTLPALGIAGRERLEGLVDRRLAGEPLAHLSGRQAFMGIEMLAGPQALIPRIETELLGYAALRLLRGFPGRRQLRIADICTGSGNLACALAIGEPRARVVASDLSRDATDLAQRNVVFLGLQGRVTIRTGDLLTPLERDLAAGAFALVTCNPPYISTGRVSEMPAEISEHEPALAFDGGPLGIGILQRTIKDAPRFLLSGGWLAMEVGSGQGHAVARRLAASSDFVTVETITDDDGDIRAVLAQTAA